MTETTNSAFDKDTVAAEVAAAFPDSIKGRTVLITGVNKAGIGFGIAEAFASQSPKTLILAGRTAEKLQACADELHAKYSDIDIRYLLVNLASQKSIRHAASEVLGWNDVPAIHLVINNAGIMRHGENGKTIPLSEDGLEDMFATNHVGHYLLTNLIMPKVIAGAQNSPKGSCRVINVSSSGTWVSPFRSSDIAWKRVATELPENERPNFTILKGAGMQIDEDATYIPTAAYGSSKTCNILYSVGLNEKLYDKYSILSLSLNPGDVKTELSRYTDRAWLDDIIAKRAKAGMMHWKSPTQAASTPLVAACDPRLSLPGADGTGQYLSDCQIAQAPAYAVDKEAARKLWQISEDLVGQTFSF